MRLNVCFVELGSLFNIKVFFYSKAELSMKKVTFSGFFCPKTYQVKVLNGGVFLTTVIGKQFLFCFSLNWPSQQKVHIKLVSYLLGKHLGGILSVFSTHSFARN